MNDYEITPSLTDPQHIRAYAKLLGDVFTGTNKYTAEFLSWQYLQNPDGHVVGFDAWKGDTLAAHYVTIPLKAKINNQNVSGLLSLNTATHPQHQGKKLFTRLAADTYARAAEAGYKFVIGVANANSTHGFVNKLGFSLVTPLDVKLGLGHFREHQRVEQYAFRPDRNEDKLQWRLAQPGNTYTWNRHNDKSYLFAPTGSFGIQAQMGSFPALPPLQLPGSRSFQPLKLWIGLDRLNQHANSFLPLPERFKPSPLNFIYLPLSGRDIPKAEHIQFSLIDFDAY